MAIVNAFVLYQHVPTVDKKLTLKEFCIEFVKHMISTYNSQQCCGRPPTREAQSGVCRRNCHITPLELPRADVGTAAALMAEQPRGTVVSTQAMPHRRCRV